MGAGMEGFMIKTGFYDKYGPLDGYQVYFKLDCDSNAIVHVQGD